MREPGRGDRWTDGQTDGEGERSALSAASRRRPKPARDRPALTARAGPGPARRGPGRFRLFPAPSAAERAPPQRPEGSVRPPGAAAARPPVSRPEQVRPRPCSTPPRQPCTHHPQPVSGAFSSLLRLAPRGPSAASGRRLICFQCGPEGVPPALSRCPEGSPQPSQERALPQP